MTVEQMTVRILEKDKISEVYRQLFELLGFEHVEVEEFLRGTENGRRLLGYVVRFLDIPWTPNKEALALELIQAIRLVQAARSNV